MSETNNTPLPEPTLETLLLNLAAAALAHLGHEVLPGQKAELNLALAKHTIDTIELLRRKTEGNRTEAETRAFDELLYELRLQYVKAEQQPGSSGLIIDPSNPNR